ncbi:DoxX family protein [Paenarthrobacter sp. CM16]|uniref:DoxX family protein n=1 Tax=Paenarthrobacter sp. CM16 TaxID=2738447 RepID=UPI0015536EE3|nr:DoxX family protein [Paenarthrobacter sp. CM16]NQD87767.1 DoxX family protein [Paenarthrobacter sp. CM16]
MNVLLWILADVLAAIFLAVGLMAVLRPKEKLAAAGMGWVEGFNPAAVKAIGALEVLAAVGLTLPALVAGILVPLAATGLIAFMVGAAITHARKKETPMIVLNLVLLAMAAVVAWGRFGPHSF